MPSLGADMDFGTILEWRVQPGDRVKRGDVVALVDTEKAEIEVEIWDAGIVDGILVPPGQKVPVGTLLATLRSEAEAPAAMEAAAQVEMGRLRSYLPVLDTIITLSPLLGLLGTVTGMIAAFGILSTSGMNQPTAITGGVAEALIATAAGLAIAIGTLVPYNYFAARAEQAMDAMERVASRLDVALREQRIP